MFGTRRVTCSKFHTEGPQLYGIITVHNLVARAISGLGFMQYCVKCNVCRMRDISANVIEVAFRCSLSL